MITAWSPSKLEKYESCPLKCKLETVDKLCTNCFAGAMKGWNPQTCTKCGRSPEEGAALKRGTLMHSAAENFITGKADMHPDLKPVAAWLKTYRAAYKRNLLRVEVEVALTREWKPTGWFDKDCWLRAKIDVQDMRDKSAWEVVDWKTGKYKPDGEFSDALNIYSTALMSAFGQPRKVTSMLVFIDAGKSVERPEGNVRRRDVEKAQKRWEDRTKAMLSDTIFAPKPSYLCRYCPFAKTKGGPCQY